ncbi:hypothetical protein ACQ4PT_068781 [Festuca glaucescens]
MEEWEVFLYVCFLPLFVFGLSIACCILSGCIELRRKTEERNAAEFAHRERVAVRRARILAAAAAAQWMPEEQVLMLTAAAAPPVLKKKKLGCFPYSAAVEGGTRAAWERQLECAICLEAFVHGATCSEVPACRHLFHRECIETWMRSKNTVSCPLCRAHIVPGSEPLSAAEDMV